MDRRGFVEASALFAGGALLDGVKAAPTSAGEAPDAARDAAHAAAAPTIGIQVGAVSFVDEGTGAVLDRLRESGAVDTIFLATFTYGRGIAGRQPRGSPLPDHGKQEYDDAFRGGNYATPHARYYRRTSIAPEKAPEHPGYDVIADVLPKARRRKRNGRQSPARIMRCATRCWRCVRRSITCRSASCCSTPG